MLIDPQPFSSTDPIRECQAELIATLIQDLVDEDRIETDLAGETLELRDFLDLPAYKRFSTGASGCGFVCSDLASDAFDINQPRVAQVLETASLPEIRAYMHVLLRAERWSYGESSFVREALSSGALSVVGRRLAEDRSLRSS